MEQIFRLRYKDSAKPIPKQTLLAATRNGRLRPHRMECQKMSGNILPPGMPPVRPGRIMARNEVRTVPSALYLKNVGRAPAYSHGALTRKEAKNCVAKALGELAGEGTKSARGFNVGATEIKSTTTAHTGIAKHPAAAPPRPITPAPSLTAGSAPAPAQREMKPYYKNLLTLCDCIKKAPQDPKGVTVQQN
ncbi:MAG: hypothetical protein Q7U14_06715, partial [Lacisediminimonas sp.]|nr:hypothetical protein [Lacisediminimonas sp.]